MAKRAKEVIPKDIQQAAKDIDHNALPTWFVGRRNREIKLAEGLGKVVAKAREEAGLVPPKLVDSSSGDNQELASDK
jgi:hypothetical protein